MTSIRKCLLCGWQTEDGSVCKALKCKVFAIKKEGELLSFPGFMKFVLDTKLSFHSYDKFDRAAIAERADLYRSILRWNWNN